MKIRNIVAVLLASLHELTDSYGTPSDRPKVRAFMADPGGSPFDTYLYVGRIPLSNFYAHVESVFDKASLWQEVQRRLKSPDLPQPGKWDAGSLVSDLALWIDANS